MNAYSRFILAFDDVKPPTKVIKMNSPINASLEKLGTIGTPLHYALIPCKDQAAMQVSSTLAHPAHKRVKPRNSSVKSRLHPLIDLPSTKHSRHLHTFLEPDVDLFDVRIESANPWEGHPRYQYHYTLSIAIYRMEVFLMAKSRALIDRNAIDRFRKEGRGQGTLQDYKPWLTVRDVSSHGRSSRDKGWKTGRTHHFLSILELLYYLILEWSLMVTDIREQYPLLPIDDTLAIADSLDIKHPAHPKTKEPIVMTTDFYISLRNDRATFEHARTVKYA